MMMPSQLSVYLYIPNLLGYARIYLAFYGMYLSSNNKPVEAVITFVLSASLDLFDGILARALKQTSAFGILLDIAADNILRTCGWIAAIGHPETSPLLKTTAVAIICLEWITMLATQLHAAHSQQHWKAERANDPWLVRTLYANGFKNPIGIIVVYGLFSANLWTYGEFHPELYDNIPYFDLFKYVAYFGRALGCCVELWMNKGYLSLVIQQDTKKSDD